MSLILAITKISSVLTVSSASAIGLTLAIAFVLLASNFVIINAQQQQMTSQPGGTNNGAFATATPPPTTLRTFQSTNDSFSIQVLQGWIIQDLNNTGSALLEEARQGYGILAQLCPEEEQQQQGTLLRNASGGSTNSSSNTSSCQVAQDVIHIVRYPDLDTRLSPNNITATNDIVTTNDNILLYHLQKLQEVGYRDIQIVNSADMTVNLTNPQTNQTTATVPAKLVEMTYSIAIAPNETRTGYFLSTATNATTPNLGMTKGYSVFYEGSSVAATAAPSALSQTPPPPTVAQVFDSFELIAANSTANPTTMNARPLSPFQQQQQQAAVGQTGERGEEGDTSCHPSYPDVCIPPPPPNLNCGDIAARNFEVVGSDPHGFDGNDNDGIGCESGSNAPDDSGDDVDDDEGGDDGGGDEGGDDGGGDEGGGAGDDEFDDCVVPPGRDPGDAGC